MLVPAVVGPASSMDLGPYDAHAPIRKVLVATHSARWRRAGRMLPVVWVLCAAAIITAAVRSRRHPDALRMGRIAVGVLYVAAGAAVNAYFLLRGDDYGTFADGSYIPYVRETWRSVVVPNHDVWITLLIAFELIVGVLAVLGGWRTLVAYAAAIVFHIALLSFGWGFFLWSVPMVVALATLLRAERRRAPSNSRLHRLAS